MNQRKQNISRWYLLGLAVILAAGCLMLSVGTAYARYRLDSERLIPFTNKIPAQVVLGTAENGAFDQNGKFAWQWAQLTEGEGGEAAAREVYQLTFAVSNYNDIAADEGQDLLVRVRLVGTLDAWNGTSGGTVVLQDGTVLADGTQRQVTATVTEIPEDTALYHAFGKGWVFQFLDEYGRELTWHLEGGKLSFQELQITMDAAAVNGTSLLQLQVSGEHTE